MANKNKGKVVQMLSPENYIKQKARNLPIHECWINSGWDDDGLANIVVARKHTNGNFTIGLYLIDLKCLGVKDAHYWFNISPIEYRDILDHSREAMDIEKVGYELVHNVVFAGIEFAEEYGFKPHKDFGVAQYILEEDTDDIELMEIECGHNGQPLYVRGPLDNDVRAAQIIAQLEKTAGQGNFDFINEVDDELDDNREEWEREIEEQEERLNQLSHPEKIKRFQSLIPRIEKLSFEEKADLGYLLNVIVEEYVDFDKVEETSDNLFEKLNEYEISENPSDILLGLQSVRVGFDRERWATTFIDVYNKTLEKPKKAKKEIDALKKEMLGNPALAFLELYWLQTTESEKYEKRLKEYHDQFPDYPLIHIFWEMLMHFSKKQNKADDLFEQGPAAYFPNQTCLHEIEVMNYLLMLVFASIAEADLTLMMTVDWLLDELELSELNYEMISQLLIMARTQFIMNLEV